MPMKQEHEAFAAMFGSLDENYQKTAKLSQTFTDVIAGQQKDSNFASSLSGIRVGNLSEDKQALIIKAIETYVVADKVLPVIIEKL